MDKVIISEERLNALINESLQEVIEEWSLRDTAGKVWNGVKQAVRDPIGTYGSVRGWVDQQRSNMQSRFRDAYNTARDRVRAQTVDRDPWAGISPEEKAVMLQVRGFDEFGNARFRTIRYAKRLKLYGYKVPQIVDIMALRG